MARLALPCLLVLTASLLLGGCGGDDGGIKIGVVLPMSGDQATYGEESWNGMQLAIDDVRAENEDLDFEVILRDEKSTPSEANTQAKALMQVEGAHVLVGSVASSITKTMASAARDMGVPAITPASTNDKLTEENPYLSRICYKDAFQAEKIANFALENGWKKCAIIVDQQNDYSTGLARNFKERFEAAGGVTKSEYFRENERDFSTIVRGVAEYDPEVIFFTGYYTAGGLMIKQAKGSWEGKPILAADGVDSPDFLKLLGDATNTIYFSTHFAPSQPDPKVQSFVERYEARFGKAPGAMAALGYDVFIVLVDAIKRAEDPTSPEQLKAAIEATKDVKCITGTIDLTSPDRTPRKDLVFVKVEGGARSFLKLVTP